MEHGFPFNPTYCYGLEALQRVPAPVGPGDFADFWRRTYDEAMAVPTRLEARPIHSLRADTDAFEVEFDSLDGARIGAWVTIPKSFDTDRGLVIGHGYGDRAAPDWKLPGPAAPAIFPCCRGLGRSKHPRYQQGGREHVLQGIDSRDTYIFRGCAADLWAAATVLMQMVPRLTHVAYLGGSFGGGIGALALPWDKRITRAFLDVPSFGNHPLRVTLPCVGSGHHVTGWWKEHPEVLDVLAYFDAATAARYVRVPTLVGAAVFDPFVPPPGQFAVYNGLISCERKLFVREAAHFDWPGAAEEQQRMEAAWDGWFA